MTLMTRLSRLMRADLNAVLDRLEEPDILLAQALRDMQQALTADEHALAAMRLDHKRILQRREVQSQQRITIAADLDICLDADNDELARNLLRRRLEHERLDALLSQRERALKARIEGLAETINQHQRRLEAVRAEAALVSATQADTEEPCGYADSDSAAPVRDTDVEVALLSEKRRRSS